MTKKIFLTAYHHFSNNHWEVGIVGSYPMCQALEVPMQRPYLLQTRTKIVPYVQLAGHWTRQKPEMAARKRIFKKISIVENKWEGFFKYDQNGRILLKKI